VFSLDVAAKDGSQEMAVSLLGILIGLLISPLISSSQSSVWILFIVFTYFHLFANYKAVSSIAFDTLNQQRAAIVYDHYLNQLQEKKSSFSSSSSSSSYIKKIPKNQKPIFNNCLMMSPSQVANQERILTWKRFSIHIELGVRIADLTCEGHVIEKLIRIFSNEKYLLYYNEKKGLIGIALFKLANSLDMLKAYFHAEVIRYTLELEIRSKSKHLFPMDTEQMIDIDIRSIFFLLFKKENNNNKTSTEKSLALIEKSYSFVEYHFPIVYCKLTEQGWHTEYNLLGAKEWRIFYGKTENLQRKKLD